MRSDTVIKILSLGIGLAVVIVLIAKICFETSYDSFYKDIDRIYSIRTKTKAPDTANYIDYPNISGAVANGFKAEVPGVEETTFIAYNPIGSSTIDGEHQYNNATGMSADENFFRVFDRPIIAGGNPEEILADPGNIMISESFAQQLGGMEELIDKTLKTEYFPDGLIIKGIFKDFPPNGQFHFDYLLSIYINGKRSLDNWFGNDRYNGFVKLEKGIDPNTLDYSIRKMQEAHQDMELIDKISMSYILKPFSWIHTSDPKVRSTVLILTIIAALIIIISVLNYLLIVISSLVKRSREIGIRKCYGAGTSAIYSMLSREGLIHLTCSLILAALIILAGRNLILNLFGIPFATLMIWQSIVAIIILTIIILAVSIVVPAHIYMSVPIYSALKNYTSRSKVWKMILLGVQIMVNIFLISMIFIIGGQYQYMSTASPGYNFDDIYYFRFFGSPDQQKRIVEELQKQSFVKQVEASESLPMYTSSGDNITLPGDDNVLFNAADQLGATSGFYEIFQIPFVEGNAPRNKDEIAVSESFAQKMKEVTGWDDGIVGKRIYVTSYHDPQNGTLISGVYKDHILGNYVKYDQRPSVRYLEILGDSVPTVFGVQYFYVKVHESTSNAISRITEILSEQLDGKEIPVNSYTQAYLSSYNDSKNMRNTIFVGAIVSIVIALLGLIGFTRDETERRRKEMAIRKITGATTRNILGNFTWSVIKLSLVSAAFAIVGAIFVSGNWLEQFALKIDMSPLFFIYSTAVVLIIVTLVVTFNCLRMARSNPINSLRND